MPSKRQYDLVQNDDYDTRIPLHPEEAFHHGITFQTKFIGMLDVPRPTSRVEIVAAMRRIRYEFKAKGIKKKKVLMEVSVEGVKVTLRKKKKRRHWTDDKSVLFHHPIYRIFYVSHDSQDLKIFSYIARDGASNVFKCAVFKAHKKSQAMRIVRTVGQAFEVCHKLSISAPEDNFDDEQDTTVTQDLLSDRLSDVASDKPKKEVEIDRHSLQPDESSLKDSYLDNSIKSRKPPPQLDILPPPPPTPNARKSSPLHAETYAAPHSEQFVNSTGTTPTLPPPGAALSAHHEIQLLREQLEQQRQQTQAAVAQLQLAREQMQAEQTARMEAQARTHQLLVHNRELLDHIAALVAHLQGGDKLEKPSSPPHVTMPQASSDPLQALGNCHSPLRTTFNPGGLFNFSYPTQLDNSFESQLLQRMGSYPPLNPYFPSPTPYLSQPYYNQTLMPLQAYATLPRTYPSVERSRHSEPRQIYSMQQNDTNNNQQEYHQQYGMQRRHSLLNLNEEPPKRTLQVNQESNQRASPKPSEGLIKPLSQVGTLTTTDSEGRVRVIVPVPSNSEDGDKLSDLRISDELRLMNGPGISRSASERVPNRSELLSQVQRTMWARHTTK